MPIKGGRANVIELDQHNLGEAMQAYLFKKTGQRTVPNVRVPSCYSF